MMGKPIPMAMRREMAEMPFYKLCALRSEHECAGINGGPIYRITWEHAMIYAGSKVNEIWAIIPLCEWSHLGKGLNKEKNQWIALCRATDEDLAKYPKSDWRQKRGYLVDKYGFYGGKPVDKLWISGAQPVDKRESVFDLPVVPMLSTAYPQVIPRKIKLESDSKVTSFRIISVTEILTKKPYPFV